MAEDWHSIAKALGYDVEREMWLDLYINHKMSIITLATKMGFGTATIVRRLDKAGIARRGKGGANNSLQQSWRLMMLSPRVLFGMRDVEIARLMKVHVSTVYKVKRKVRRV